MSVRIDQYGLHAEECSCLRCESGNRPSAGERQRARDVWERAQKTIAALNRPLSKKEIAAEERRRQRLEAAQAARENERRWRVEHPPLSPEQIRELEEFKAQRFPALGGGSRR